METVAATCAVRIRTQKVFNDNQHAPLRCRLESLSYLETLGSPVVALILSSYTGGPCCGGGCCTDNQSCCSDAKGYSCCMTQNTFCAPVGTSSGYPARCCPRWTVACEIGSVGCCDPATPWQTAVQATAAEDAIPAAATNVPSTSEAGLAALPPTAFALVVSGARSAGKALLSLTIDTSSGKITRKAAVTGFDDDPAGESTREFLWDPGRRVFYYFDANFTAGGGGP